METRERLLEVTLRLMAEKGYEDFGLREVAELAGTKTSSIYHFYGGKAELCRAAVEHFGAMIHEDEKALGDREEPPIDTVRRVFDWIWSTSTTEGWRRDLGLALEPAPKTIPTPERPDGPFDPPPFVRMLREPVLAAIDAGQLRVPEGYTADEVASFVVVSTIGVVRMTARRPDEISVDRALGLLFDSLMRALTVDQPTPSTPAT